MASFPVFKCIAFDFLIATEGIDNTYLKYQVSVAYNPAPFSLQRMLLVLVICGNFYEPSLEKIIILC